MFNVSTEIRRKLLDTLFMQPIEYGQLLMVIGYEPTPPIVKRNFMGEKVLELPNIVAYVNHIYAVDGFTGFSPGLSSRMIMCLLRHMTEKKVDDCFVLWNTDKEPNKKGSSIKLYSENRVFIKKLARDVVASIATNIITQPFQVVAIRSMAQFIGKETKYINVWSSLKIIYTEQGVEGLFSGLAPRTIRDVTNIIILASLSYAIKAYLTNNEIYQYLLKCISSLLVRNLTYPFHVVSTCMAVNDVGLKAGSPPALPIFTHGWKNCWNYLSQTNQLRRGSFPLLRYSRLPKSPTVLSEATIHNAARETAAEQENDVIKTVHKIIEEVNESE